MKIETDIDLRGVKVCVNGEFNAVLQGGFRYSALRQDYMLEVESSDFPLSEVPAGSCEVLEEEKRTEGEVAALEHFKN